MNNIIEKIKKSGLTGRSGSCFPVWLKWDSLKKEGNGKKYIICNASEGEPETFKDYFILKRYPEEVIKGINVSLDFFKNSFAYIYLKKEYFKEIKESLGRRIGERIILFEKKGGYLGGEETAIIEAIQGNPPEPRIKPPFPSEKGLWGYPTLIHNVETFYFIYRIFQEEYKGTKFYSISGDIRNPGVFEFSEKISVESILKQTGNFPKFEYFLQIGGGAGGEIITSEEIKKPVKGLGSIIVYNKSKNNPLLLMNKWADFFVKENCDKCAPCREGLYRIKKLINEKKLNQIDDIFFVLEKTGLCPLAKIAVKPFKSLIEKIIK